MGTFARAFGIGDEIPDPQRLAGVDNSLPCHLNCATDYRSWTLERHLPPSAVCAVDKEEVQRDLRSGERLVLVLPPERVDEIVDVRAFSHDCLFCGDTRLLAP